MSVSIIIPVYNESKVIVQCLESLENQTFTDFEIILVDDGSTDNTIDQIQKKKGKIQIFQQQHKGPGAARNLGASKASGDILVFVDADMTFDQEFLKNLILPIKSGETIGTFSKEEYLANPKKAYARCWNLNLGRRSDRMHPDNYPDKQAVFRAILKEKFVQAGGFDTQIGYTDDWSISRKLGVLAQEAPGAKYYHFNPESLKEVWAQARWFGKNEFLTKNLIRRLFNLYRYFPLFSIFKGIIGAIKYREINFILFKIIYDTAVFTSICLAFIGEQKAK